jgi:ATP-dependent helicase/nuclease subunit A
VSADSQHLPADHDHRRRIAADFTATLFVEAGAGTGKTHALVTRVLEMLGVGHLEDIRNLAAITFTEAAASELRDRIRSRLELAVRGGEAGDPSVGRWARALEVLDDAAISTLHGFAQRLLSEFPLEANLPPGFEVVDPIRAGIEFEERWEVFVDDVFADDELQPTLRRAFSMGARLDHLRDVAVSLHQHWDRLRNGPAEAHGPDTIDVTPLLAALDDALRLLPACPPDDLLVDYTEREVVPFFHDLSTTAAKAAKAAPDARPGEADEEALLDLLRVLVDDAPAIVGKNGKRSGIVAELRDQLKNAAAIYESLLADLRRDALLPLLDRVVAFTLSGAAERCHRGQLEFHDLLVLAVRLLADQSVRRVLTRRYTAVLIDEFQDTDPLQVELAVMLALLDPDVAPTQWDAAELRPGRLFLVGDPKQSIYRFRRADITVYEQAKAVLSGGVVPLSSNFRSRPGIIDWVNAVFGEMITFEAGAQPGFEPLVADRPDAEIGPAVRVLGTPHDRRVGEIREIEAAEIAAAIVQLKADNQQVVDEVDHSIRSLEYADIALLLPTRTSLSLLEQALERAGVPYRVESRSLVFGSDEVQELLAILQAIENPSDEVAIVAALRSPGFACSDVELAEFRRAGGRWRYPSTPPDGIDDDHPVVAGLRRLQGFHDEVPWRPVNELVDDVIRTCRLVELTIGRHRPRDHWRRYRLLLDEARAFVEAGGQSLGDFVAWVQLQADEQATRMETIVPETDDDAVRILTVHGAKGLEFPVVVLTGLNVGANIRHPNVLWNGDEPEVRIGTKDDRFETIGYHDASARERRLLELEQRRLLYVAATRARDVLFVSLHHKSSGPASPASEIWAMLDRTPHELVAIDEVSVTQPGLVGASEAIASPSPSANAGVDADVVAPDLGAELEAFKSARESLLQRAARPTAVAPTALAAGFAEPHDHPHERPPARRGRAGSSVGRAVHGVLQLIDLETFDDLAALARHQATAEGVPDRVETVEALARSALGSEPVSAARRSPRRWRELFVGAPMGGTVIEGYIDLLYEDDDGELIVVDYKTDQARTDGEIDESMQRYRLQGAAYAVALETVLDRPVREVFFVFCRPDTAVVRALGDLDAARAEVLARVADPVDRA